LWRGVRGGAVGQPVDRPRRCRAGRGGKCRRRGAAGGRGGAGGIAALPPELHGLVAAAYRRAIGTTFATGAVIAGFGLVLLLLLPERPLRDVPAG
jgi:hypothetical protein